MQSVINELSKTRHSLEQLYLSHMEKYPQYVRLLPHMKLCRIGRNTGARGVRWFSKNDITLAILAAEGYNGRISAFSWYPFGDTGGIVGMCRLTETVPVEWLE